MNNSSLHEWLELVKTLAWPGVVLYCVWRYAPEVKIILRMLGGSLERVKTAKGFGVEFELAQTAESASSEAEQIEAVPELRVFKPTRCDDGGER
jgi:hypothetical protein